MTDRSSEERSRFEKWREDMKFDSSISDAMIGGMRTAWMARAALEDRQEAAPEVQGGPIPLNENQEDTCKLWAKDDRLWTTRETVAFNLRPFARAILARGPARSKRTESFAETTFREVRDERDDLRQRVKELEWKLDNSGVPSEATPSKENAPPECICPTETWTVDGSDMNDSMCEIDHDSPAPKSHEEESEEMISPTGKRHERYPGCEDFNCKPAPAPEVQGTPTKDKFTARYCFECENRDKCASAETCYAHHEGYPRFTDSVGTPQKETPPQMPICPKCGAAMALLTVRPNVQDWYGCNSCDSSEVYGSRDDAKTLATLGVQGKEPQTFEEWWQIKRDYAGNWSTAAKGIAGHAYTSGEAAGRRSAITEIREWVAKNSAEAFDEWSAGYQRRLDHLLVKCSEMER